MRSRPTYERDDETFPHDAYAVSGWGRGIAFSVLGWETESGWREVEDEETDEWYVDEYEDERTGRVVVVMVGDDKRHLVDVEDLSPLGESDYCHSCGQVGCGHNVPDED